MQNVWNAITFHGFASSWPSKFMAFQVQDTNEFFCWTDAPSGFHWPACNHVLFYILNLLVTWIFLIRCNGASVNQWPIFVI
jgi:hypothetical protein